MHLCLDLTHHPWTRGADPAAAVARTLALARAADAAGVEAIWVSEDPEGWDAFALLAALARETTRARLGPGVTNPYVRHPNLLAAAVATLDRLSAGRAVLGLGRGQPEWYARALGVEVGSPLAALEGTIDLLRQWWTPPHRASSDGHFRVHDWERTVHPVQTQPPIYLAAAGPKALALAARRADGVIFNALTSDDFLAAAIPRVRAEAAAAGRDPAALAFVLRTAVTVTDDPVPVLERQKTSIALINTLPGMDRLLATDGFDVPAILAEVRRLMRTDETLAHGGGFPALRRAGDLAAARSAIPTDLVARLALVGPLPHLRARLRRLTALGVTHVSVAPPSPDHPPDTLAATIQALRESGA
jgi:5,10-methylenetetrahydromethanopterin reductase